MFGISVAPSPQPDRLIAEGDTLNILLLRAARFLAARQFEAEQRIHQLDPAIGGRGGEFAFEVLEFIDRKIRGGPHEPPRGPEP